MDETMRNIRMKNEVLKNYIIEEERDKNYNKRIDMIDEILKENQNFIDILSTELEYLVSWVIRDSDFIGKNGTRFSAKFEVTKENEFKILLRCLLIGIILIEKGSDVLLGIDEKVRRCLENFMKNLSNRKRIDEDYYLEMLAIEKFLQDEDMKLDILGHSELENILEEKREMGKFLL
ncbi:957_t:CDS:2 [Rhizophagus irregularis]|nr:957_t:CDS:2 [Rhizophagus irregularis]